MDGNGKEATIRAASDFDAKIQSLPSTFDQHPLLLKNLFDLYYLEKNLKILVFEAFPFSFTYDSWYSKK